MVILPEAGTETTIPSDPTFDKSSMMYTLTWRDLRFHLVLVNRLEIKKNIFQMNHEYCPSYTLYNTV